LKFFASIIALFLNILDEFILEEVEPFWYHIGIILSEYLIHFLVRHNLPFLMLPIFLLSGGIASHHTVEEAKAHLCTTSFFH